MADRNTNGVIRIGRKGRKKFAIGDEDDPRRLPVFEVDVVRAFQQWLCIDETFRDRYEDRTIPNQDMEQYHSAAIEFVGSLMAGSPDADLSLSHALISGAEALDFLARLRECYDEVAAFFQPKSREERDSPDTSEVELQFSAEAN